MEFLSAKTKERIAKLEQENAKLKSAVNAPQKGTSLLWILIPWILFILSVGGGVFLFLQPKALSDEEIAKRQVELWRDGSVRDTIITPDMNLKFSIQVGAYKDLEINDYNYGLSELSYVEDSTFTRVNLGEFTSLPVAQDFLKLVINMGFERAFIVAYKGDNAVGLLSETTALN